MNIAATQNTVEAETNEINVDLLFEPPLERNNSWESNLTLKENAKKRMQGDSNALAYM